MNKRIVCHLTLVVAMAFVNPLSAQDWPGLLGPDGSARTSQTVPTEWSEKENLLWKLELPGAGSSSPVIIGDRLFVTCYKLEGDSLTRFVVCVDKKNGGKEMGERISS